MRVIELSNHPGDMLAEVSRRRRAAQGRAQNTYEDELIQYQARVQTIRVKRDRARRNRQWWTWLRLFFAVQAEKRRVPRLTVPDQAGTDAEEKIRAGIAGEQLVATDLGRALGDDWTLLRGYRPGSQRDATVHIGTSAGDVLDLVRSPADALGAQQRAEVQRLIRRDHDFNQRRR